MGACYSCRSSNAENYRDNRFVTTQQIQPKNDSNFPCFDVDCHTALCDIIFIFSLFLAIYRENVVKLYSWNNVNVNGNGIQFQWFNYKKEINSNRKLVWAWLFRASSPENSIQQNILNDFFSSCHTRYNFNWMSRIGVRSVCYNRNVNVTLTADAAYFITHWTKI